MHNRSTIEQPLSNFRQILEKA